MKACKPEYLAKALLLSPEEQERLLSRMSGKLPNRLDKNKISVDEALALQLEIEDEQLNEWRERMHSLKAKDVQKPSKQSKDKEKIKSAVAEKPALKEPKTAKPAAPAKAEKVAGTKSTTKPKAPAAKPKPAAKTSPTRKGLK